MNIRFERKAMVAMGALILGTLAAKPQATEAGCGSGRVAADAVASRLTELETQLLAADYRGDVAALERLRDQAAALASDAEWGFLARYWSGFASWRAAINGVNVGMPQPDLRAHLERAVAEFEASIAARDAFADGWAAAAGAHGWLARFYPEEPAKALRHVTLYFMRLRRAKLLEPDNLRVLWIDASVDLFMPPQLGGDPPRAVATYRRMLELARRPREGGPLPDWGEPEAYMSLAFAHSNQGPLDLEAASEAAHEALRLQPEWSYVRNVLLPQIDEAIAEATASRPAP